MRSFDVESSWNWTGTGARVSGDLVFDAGALIALERGDRHVASLLQGALALGLRVFADAHVVCCALENGAAVATSGPVDIRSLVGPRERLTLIPV